MYKFLILLLFIPYQLLACSMCAVSVPKVDVHTTIFAKQSSTTFDVKWQFHPEFNKALTVYDVNNNGKYERAERDAIKQSIEDYITPINFLLNVEYLTKNEKFSKNFLSKFVINFSRLTFNENDAMVYEYNIDLPIRLKKDHKLYVEYFDDGGNFDFVMKDLILKEYNDFKMIQPKFTSSTIYFYQTDTINELKPKVLSIQEVPQKSDMIQVPQSSIEEESILKYLTDLLENIKDLLEQNLQDIKENNSLSSYIWLLFFSFAYGIIHALGPGHGKTLISSYFLGQNRSYMKALSISAMIGIVHTFSAFVLTIIVYYVIGTLLSSFITDVERMAVKVSAGIIILIALYLLFQKLTRNYKKALTFSPAAHKPSFVKTTTPQHVHTNTLSCSCSGCQTQSTDIGIILAAGLVPCPGTVTVFIFTMGLGIYFVGFLSAVFMSLGMALVIFVTALISVKIRKSASTNQTMVKILEYGSVFFILILGVILLII